MSTITAETAAKIYAAHREIEAAEILLKELTDKPHEWLRKKGEALKDRWDGKNYCLHIGTMSGSASSRISSVNPELARYIIEAHVAEKRKDLAEWCLEARLELDGLAGKPATVAGATS